MKVKIYTFPDKRPDFIELQKKSIEKFLKDDYEYIIINNGSNNELRKEIFDICNNNGIKHIYVENPNHSDPNIACSYPINQTLDKYIKVEREKDIISVIIDSDMFFISDFSIVDFIGSNEISAIYQVRGDVNYLWNGIVFINNSKVVDIESFDFGYQMIDGNPTDVGGNMYFYLKEHPNCKIKYIYHTLHIKSQNNNLDSLPDEILEIYDDSFCYEIIEKSILHYGRGSNWDNMNPDYHKRKTELLHFFLNGCLNDEIKTKNINSSWKTRWRGDKMRKIFIDGGARLGESIDIIKNDITKYLDFEYYLFEPNSECHEHLRNLENTNSKVKFIEGALWNKNGESDFFIANDIWGNVGSTLHTEKMEKLDRENPLKVKTYDIVDVIGWFSEDDYIVLKLDVEGSEYDIINRLLEYNKISNIKEYLIEWHDHFYDDVNKNRFSLIKEIEKYSQYNDWLY